jgi:hypothetical protein
MNAQLRKPTRVADNPHGISPFQIAAVLPVVSALILLFTVPDASAEARCV